MVDRGRDSLALTAIALTRLDVPPELAHTDYRALLRGMREGRTGGSPMVRLFGGTVSAADVLEGEVFVGSPPPRTPNRTRKPASSPTGTTRTDSLILTRGASAGEFFGGVP